MLRRSQLLRHLAACGLALLTAACSPAPARPVTRVAVTEQATAKQEADAPPRDVFVLMLNGGGNPRINYRSHLLHLKELYDLLRVGGIERDRISVLASDGQDPGLDLATREIQTEQDFWRVQGTRLESLLRMPIEHESSSLPGVQLSPATKLELAGWFGRAAAKLGAGDTLLLYVTDHGTRHGEDPLDNRITLWGNTNEAISVRELGELLAQLAPQVRVLTLMSQCYSGGFAELALRAPDGAEPRGNFCGYFSSTADRPAYGCFPENFGKDNVGYSFDFINALRDTGSFRDAHEAVLVHDATPDVPLRTSDAYLEAVVQTAARAAGAPLDAFADGLLRSAFGDAGRYEHDARLLDHIAQATGSFSPRSLGELAQLAARLPEIDQQLELVKRAWRDALSDANVSNLDRFFTAYPDWGTRLVPAALAALPPRERHEATEALLADLERFTAERPARAQRIEALARRGEDAKAAAYRMQVRLAVLLRMRKVLLSVAGRRHLETAGTPEQRAAYEQLLSCEDLSLPKLVSQDSPRADGSGVEATTFPPFEQDLELTREALPGWMGIRFKPPDRGVLQRRHLSEGASLVALVYPDSPAQAAGLEAGDIVIGPPGEPFTAFNQIRAWTMLSQVGEPGQLEILRGGQKKVVTLVPGPFPMKWPELPGPVKQGDTAPKLQVHAYRGPVATSLRKEHLLYFWATWCGPCKAAVPELVAYEKQTGVPVIAVTDEDKETLDGFIRNFPIPFPQAIASDELRQSFVTYGVSGTPTFVLVDDQGKVVWSQIGYRPGQGLTIPGWTWKK